MTPNEEIKMYFCERHFELFKHEFEDYYVILRVKKNSSHTSGVYECDIWSLFYPFPRCCESASVKVFFICKEKVEFD